MRLFATGSVMSDISGDITTAQGGELQLLATEELAIVYIKLLHYKQELWAAVGGEGACNSGSIQIQIPTSFRVLSMSRL